MFCFAFFLLLSLLCTNAKLFKELKCCLLLEGEREKKRNQEVGGNRDKNFLFQQKGWKMLFNLLVSLNDLLWMIVGPRSLSINCLSYSQTWLRKKLKNFLLYWEKKAEKSEKRRLRSFFSVAENGNHFAFHVVCLSFFLFILSCRFPICFALYTFVELNVLVEWEDRRGWWGECEWYFNFMRIFYLLNRLSFWLEIFYLLWAHLNCKFLVLVSRSAWPAVYCSITSFTSYGLSASRNFLRAEKYCS